MSVTAFNRLRRVRGNTTALAEAEKKRSIEAHEPPNDTLTAEDEAEHAAHEARQAAKPAAKKRGRKATTVPRDERPAQEPKGERVPGGSDGGAV